MKIIGNINQVQPLQTGVSAQGNEWKRLSFVVREDDHKVAFPDEMVLDLWNERIPAQPLVVGMHVEVFFGAKTRVYNEHLFNDFNVVKLAF
jgi:hypothetical protein